MDWSPFERRRRRIARIALYTSLGLVGLWTWGFYHFVNRPFAVAGDVSWYGQDWEARPEVRLLQQFVRIASDPEGDEYAAALWLAGPLQAAGIPVHVERLGTHQANLWATLEGERPEPLILLNHLDVEPVDDPDSWEVPPFSGELFPPLIHGRGTFDMKSYTIGQLLGVLDLASRDTPPARSVRLVATAEEEQGSELGVRWLLSQHPEVFEDGWAVLTEGGIVETRNVGDVKYWGIEYGQRAEYTFLACADTRQRLEELREDIVEYTWKSFEVDLTPEAILFLEAYRASRERPNLRAALEDIDRFSRDPALVADLPPVLRAILRSEPAITEPFQHSGTWTSHVYLHMLPGADPLETRRRLIPDWLLAGIQLHPLDSPGVESSSPIDHPVVRGIEAFLAEDLPRSAYGPFLLSQAKTDARFLRPLPLPVYGWTPFDFQVSLTLRAGQPHEKVDLPGYRDGIDRYRRLITYLVESPPTD